MKADGKNTRPNVPHKKGYGIVVQSRTVAAESTHFAGAGKSEGEVSTIWMRCFPMDRSLNRRELLAGGLSAMATLGAAMVG